MQTKNTNQKQIKNKKIISKAEIKKMLEGSLADFSNTDIEELYKLNSKKLIKKRAKGVPLQYLLKEWEFYSLPFKVGKGVLIPRPETELLVDIALDNLKENDKVLDICSGSGAIAVAIAKSKEAGGKNIKTAAIEKSRKAFFYLKENIKLNHALVTPIKANAFNLKKALKKSELKKFNLITSNPPYIAKEEYGGLQREVKFEPKIALISKNDPLKFYKKITLQSEDILEKNGKIIFEVGFSQAKAVEQILQKHNFKTQIFKDYSNNDRVVLGTKQ